jgi:hypothetical protein
MGRWAATCAVSGPSEAAGQWPMTTNDDHQARIPTALTSKNQATKISGKTGAGRHHPRGSEEP